MRMSERQRKALIVAILLSPLFLPCSCVIGIVLLHDYAPIFYTAPQWSEFSNLENASDVQATLTADLIARKPSMPETIAYLAQKGVEWCTIYDGDKRVTSFFLNEVDDYTVYRTGTRLLCITAARDRIINPGNPVEIRGYNLLVAYDYDMEFRFANGVLVDIQVEKFAYGT